MSRGFKIMDPALFAAVSLFSTTTNMFPFDYYETDNLLTFLVREDEFHPVPKTVLQELSRQLKKRVRVVAFSEDLETFVKRLFAPAKVEWIREKVGAKRILLVKVDAFQKGIALGRNAAKLKTARYFLNKYFKIDSIRIV